MVAERGGYSSNIAEMPIVTTGGVVEQLVFLGQGDNSTYQQ